MRSAARSGASWTPFQAFTDGIPFFRLRVERPLDELDVRLLATSFRNKANGQPRECGVAEVLDAQGAVLFTSPVALGRVSAVDMNEAVRAALRYAAGDGRAHTIRSRHTHPPALVGSENRTVDPWKFSDADHGSNEDFRAIMDRDPRTQRLAFEAHIVFLSPRLEAFPEVPEVYRDYGMTKGYRLPGASSKRSGVEARPPAWSTADRFERR